MSPRGYFITSFKFPSPPHSSSRSSHTSIQSLNKKLNAHSHYQTCKPLNADRTTQSHNRMTLLSSPLFLPSLNKKKKKERKKENPTTVLPLNPPALSPFFFNGPFLLPLPMSSPPPSPPSSSSSSPSTNYLTNLGLGYAIAISFGFLVLLSSLLLSSYVCCRRRRRHPYPFPSPLPTSSFTPDGGIIVPRIIFVAEDDSADPNASSPVVGLDSHVINSYPKFPFLRLPGVGSSNNTCSICLCEYRDAEMLRMMPECRHSFHLGCLDPWLKLNGSCPVCRNSPLPTPLSTPLQEVVPLSQYADNRRHHRR